MKSHKILFVTFLALVLIAALAVPANHLVGPTEASPNPCDEDQDGYYSTSYECGGNDCDDFNSAVNPGAEEVCTDNVDNDCDGDTDYEARQIACAEAAMVLAS